MNYHLTPFLTCTPIRPKLFIGREKEIQKALESIYAEGSNILIQGEPGIGKTSFLFKLKDEMEKKYNETLVIYLMLISYIYNESLDLSRLILLSIADAIWKEIFCGTYTELIELLGQPNSIITTLNKRKRSFIRIYRILRSGIIISTAENTFNIDIGAPGLVSGKKSNKYSSQYQIDGLYQYEFSRLLEELLLILENSKKSKIVLLIDEANYLSDDKSKLLLQKNFDILVDDRLQYVFVSFKQRQNQSDPVKFYVFSKILNKNITIAPFSDSSILDEMIELYCKLFKSEGNKILKYNKDVRIAIWEKSKGYPLKLQYLCQDAWINAKKRNNTIITIEDVTSNYGRDMLKK